MAVTRRAAIVALLGVFVVFIAPLRGLTVLLVEGGLLIAIVLDISLAGSVRALRVSRYGDTARRLDDVAGVGVLVVNAGRRPVRGVVRDAWPPSARVTPGRHRVDVPAGEQRRYAATLHPERRTELRAGRVTVRSVGPLGLGARQGNHEVPWTLRVLPGFPSRRHLPEKLAKLRVLDGRTAARVRGQGTEFDSLRDYVEGDDARSIDWRATARRSSVVVRTWRPERDRRLLLVLDTGRTSAARVGAAPRLEAALDAALLLGTLAARAGDRVDLMAVDDRPRALARGADGNGDALSGLLAAMAGVQPRLVETDARLLVSEVLRRVPHRALVVLFTALDEAAISEGLLPVLPSLTKRHVVLLASVADPEVIALAGRHEDARAAYDAAAAERSLGQQRRIAALLRRLKVEVVEAPPQEFASKVADAYLSLKAAGRL
ncbi:MAG: hypothetical protein QOJ62_1845 [Actinomycetota bacterium]|jgi:uncharacterized protein (DUF58 family)|nr:hypothetical protein [Actinomycetota bacterium]